MSRVISLRLQESQLERLERLARRLERPRNATAAVLIEEALRMAEFGQIYFRDSPVGRQAYVQGSGLAVWEVMLIARAYGGDSALTAEHLGWPVGRVQATFDYAAAFREEIDAALADNDAYDFDRVSRMLPQTELFVVDGGDDDPQELTAAEGGRDGRGAECGAAPSIG